MADNCTLSQGCFRKWLDWQVNSLSGIVTKSKILRSEGLEIGKVGDYDQKNLIKIATEDTDANSQTKM